MAATTQINAWVSQLYVALFGRAPDAQGLDFWAGLLASGQTLTQAADTMFGTAPARAYFPNFLTNQEVIASFYFNVLGRQADAGGLAFWTAKLDAPGATPGSVIAEMIGVIADYAGTDPVGLASAALFNNRSEAAQFYAEHNGSLEHSTTVLAGVTRVVTTVADARTLVVDTGAKGTIDAAGFSEISVGALSGNLALAHIGAGTGLSIRASTSEISPQWTLTYGLEDSSGSDDSVSITLSSADRVLAGLLNLPGMEAVTLIGIDTNSTAHTNGVYFSSAPSLRSLTVTGNAGTILAAPVHLETFDAVAALATVGGDFTSSGLLTIAGGAGDDGLQSLYGDCTISAGAGDDHIWVGGGLSIVTGGTGADIFHPFPYSSRNAFMTIVDFTKTTAVATGDLIALNHMSGDLALAWNSTKLVPGGLPTLDAYLDAATAATDILVTAHPVARWFQHAGDTYVVIDNSNATTFQDGNDQMIKLTGLVDLSSLTLILGTNLA